MRWRWLGRLGHAEAVALMAATRERVLAGDDDAQELLLCEHPPTVTLGRSADRGHVVAPPALLAAHGAIVVETSRGGDVTYHGPGQVMIYPVVRVRRGVVAFLAEIAGVLAATAADLGVPGAAWRREPAGLWLDGAKLAACGLHLRRQVANHGWAFDVATPPEMWQLVVPCGLATPVVSLDRARRARGQGAAPPVAEVAARLGPALAARWS
ncbi:MAG: lipoyl(octanoyl) transferase LipB [Kofleriaceae bacterium]|nr:lipoyl(octanoyl) transferase LipB [Kofleriaceae bacterium]